MSALTLEQLEEIEDLAARLAEMDKLHANTVASLWSTRSTPAGGQSNGHRTFVDIYSLGVQRRALERAISMLLDQADVEKAAAS